MDMKRIDGLEGLFIVKPLRLCEYTQSHPLLPLRSFAAIVQDYRERKRFLTPDSSRAHAQRKRSNPAYPLILKSQFNTLAAEEQNAMAQPSSTLHTSASISSRFRLPFRQWNV